MKALVTVASKHGGSAGIGETIADTLRNAGFEVDLMPPQEVEMLPKYTAIVIGSGVYMGRWLGEARDFIAHNAEELRQHPVWLFSSGPITDNRDDPADAAEGNRHVNEIGARGHRVFAGKLDREELGFTERAIVTMVHSPWGDYRPWDDIREWATSIAEATKTEYAVPA